jgi:hypothetical protein
MRAADCARLFTIFTKIEDARVANPSGCGLGLSICRQIVALMGGTIDVRSVYGEGSVFFFTLQAGVPGPAGAKAQRLKHSDRDGLARQHKKGAHGATAGGCQYPACGGGGGSTAVTPGLAAAAHAPPPPPAPAASAAFQSVFAYQPFSSTCGTGGDSGPHSQRHSDADAQAPAPAPSSLGASTLGSSTVGTSSLECGGAGSRQQRRAAAVAATIVAKRVLLAEDNSFNAEILLAFLQVVVSASTAHTNSRAPAPCTAHAPRTNSH